MVALVEPQSLGLDALEETARHDLLRLNYPPANWVPERTGPDGKRVLDVLVVGAGMCGQTVGYGLLREGIRNIRVIERNGNGHEGPWNTTARMPILRSPKHLTGPDLGVPSSPFAPGMKRSTGVTAGRSSTRSIGSTGCVTSCGSAGSSICRSKTMPACRRSSRLAIS